MGSFKLNASWVTRLIILTGLALASIPVSGQIGNHLILRKHGYLNKLHFLTGDPITFIREGNNYPEEYYLQGIGADFIIVSGQVIPINKITHVIRNRTGFNFRASGSAMMIAAPGYLVIGAVNALFQGISPVPTVSNLIVAGALATAGAIIPAFQVRKYHMGRKFSLAIAQSDPALNR